MSEKPRSTVLDVDLPFRDPDLPLPHRVANLLGELTLAEKLALLHQHQPAVPRLGLGAFRTGTEALHGLARLGPATVFPQAVGLASAWDPELLRRIGSVVGAELRGFHQKDPDRAGLNVWAPVVNPLRDPRWGRNEEGYAEDSWLTGLLGTAYASGLRGDDDFYLLTAPTLKHFLGYNNETDRCLTSSNMPPRVLRDYELPAFRAPLESGAAVAVMASYNLLNGRPTHLSPLINEELRGWADDDILVVGDAAAVSNIGGAQHYLPDHPSGFAAALRAGVDTLTEDHDDPMPTTERLVAALDRGLLDESDVDRAVGHILGIRFRLGEFDPPRRNPYHSITADVISSPAHQQLARDAARRSIVLLKNECGPILPLDPATVGRVAVVGPHADTIFEDWYGGTLPYQMTIRDGITARLSTSAVSHHEGLDRIALRCATGYVVATDAPDGGPLRADVSETAVDRLPEGCLFDLFDWGQRVICLRSVANRRHVGIQDVGDGAPALVNDQPGPNGWEVRETFEVIDAGDGQVLRHLQTGRYVVAGDDAGLRAGADSVETATVFTIELISDGALEAAAVAGQADITVVALGNHPLVNGRETEDRRDLALPESQEALLRAVYAANPRTVLVLTSSYPYAIGWAQTHLPAVLWSSHGGQEFGHALADVLFGGDADGRPVDPLGRLTQTWYRSAAELPDLLDYDIIATDSTYLYYRGTPLYPFGHGLSYTRFEYRDLRLSAPSVDAAGEITLSVEVRNVGDRPGGELVQLYTRQQRSRVKQPLRQLRGFQRVWLEPGEQATVRLQLRAADLAFWDVTRSRPVVETARHTIQIGRSCTDLTLTATLTVRGERIPPRDPIARPLHLVDNDDYDGTVPVDAGLERGDAVAATREGAWVAFEDVDFGAGVAVVRADASGPQGASTVVLRLDDPLDGPVVATLDVPATGHRHEFAQVSAEVVGATGIHDLFLLFGDAGATVNGLTFEAVASGPGDEGGRP